MKAEDDFVRALESAKRETSELLEKRSLIDRRLTQLKATIDSLSALVENDLDSWQQAAMDAATVVAEARGEIRDAGITDSIRFVLTASPVPLTPTQVRDALKNFGVDLDYANSLSVIHNTLRRLERQGELMTVRGPDGKVVAYTTHMVCEPPAPIHLD